MLILYIANIAIIVTFGFVLFAVYRNFDPEDKPMAGSLTSGFLAVIVAVIAWYGPACSRPCATRRRVAIEF
jgi:hypothetical protein